MNYLGNAFSLGMLDCLSCVGHLDTANLFTSLLGREVVMNRSSTSLVVGDTLLVGQYNGPRLPEGAVSLPEGARIRWILARVG